MPSPPNIREILRSDADPVEAVEAAIAICRAWRQDGKKEAKVGYEATGGMTLPFDSCTFREARQWAKQRQKKMLAQQEANDK